MNATKLDKTYGTLRDSLRGAVFLPDDPGYHEIRQVWNRRYDRKPAIIVQALGTTDVVRAVEFARDRGLPVSVRSGGHHVSGMGACDEGMMIDMSRMRSVIVNPETQTAIVQGGATAADVIRETQLFGLAVPTGNIGRVGVAALALGGGMGYLRRQYGLTCDHLEAADMVLADGSVVHVSRQHQSELFWALQGGGGNFGIAVALYLRLVRVGPTVAGLRVLYSVDDAQAVLAGCRNFLAASDNAVSINIDIMAMPPAPGMPPGLVGKTVISLSGMHAGEAIDGALREIEPLRRLATPLVDASGPMSYTALHSILDNMLPAEHQGYVESFYADTLSDDLIERVAGIMASARTGQILMLWPMGGKVAEPAPEETAFGDRGAGLVVMVESAWQNPSDQGAGIAWVRKIRSSLDEFAYNGGTYLNLHDVSQDTEVLKKSYGVNYERLKTLKRQYDPDNMFRFNANINPALP